mmetsp:Transcript_11503/g.19477  ORF Transcript_11503/g.19477 Transcript_11503/m.19477 type:complete len:204 (+) Transcript_11503:246-857(+)
MARSVLADHILGSNLRHRLRGVIDFAVRIEGVEVTGVLSNVIHFCKSSFVLSDLLIALHESISIFDLLPHCCLYTITLQSHSTKCESNHTHDDQAGKAREKDHAIGHLNPCWVRNHLLGLFEPLVDSVGQRCLSGFTTSGSAHHHHVEVGIILQRQTTEFIFQGDPRHCCRSSTFSFDGRCKIVSLCENVIKVRFLCALLGLL